MLRGLLSPASSLLSRACLALAAWIDEEFPSKALLLIARREPAVLQKYVTEQATTLAAAIMMKMMDQEGLAHCALCPQRFSLRRIDGRYACLNHSKEVGAAKKEFAVA